MHRQYTTAESWSPTRIPLVTPEWVILWQQIVLLHDHTPSEHLLTLVYAAQSPP